MVNFLFLTILTYLPSTDFGFLLPAERVMNIFFMACKIIIKYQSYAIRGYIHKLIDFKRSLIQQYLE